MSDLEKITNELQKFGFSKMEAQVYVTIVKYSGLNGSQVSKLLNSNRGSVYSALNTLYEKGAVYLLPGETNVYQAQKPEVLIENIKEKLVNEFSKTADVLKEEFSKFEDTTIAEEQYWNIKGYYNFVIKAKEILFGAEEEIYISTNYSIKEFSEEIKEVTERGVKVVVYSDERIEAGELKVDYYTADIQSEDTTKNIIVVVDYKKALIGSGKIGNDFSGTFTDNPFMVEIASEHIHFDIYVTRLEKKYGEEWFQKIGIGTYQEEEILVKKLKEIRKNKKDVKKSGILFKK